MRGTGIPEAVRSMLKSALFTRIGGRDAGNEVIVTKAGPVLVAIGIVSAVALWPKSPVNDLPAAQSISIRELHMLANPESLPIRRSMIKASSIRPQRSSRTETCILFPR